MNSAQHPGGRQGWIWLSLLRMCRRACFLPRFCCYRSSWLTISFSPESSGLRGSGCSRRRRRRETALALSKLQPARGLWKKSCATASRPALLEHRQGCRILL